MESDNSEELLRHIFHIRFLSRNLNEQYRDWFALCQQHLAGAKMRTANLDAAVALTLIGTEIAHKNLMTPFRPERHQEAFHLARALSGHPRFYQANKDDLTIIYSTLMTIAKSIDDEKSACSFGNTLLELATQSNCVPARQALSLNLFTYVFCGNLCRENNEAEATEELTRLVVDTVRAFDPDCPVSNLPNKATFRELSPLVNRVGEKVMHDNEDLQHSDLTESSRRNQDGLRCRCGHRLRRKDIIEQSTYVPEYYGANQITLKFQCSQCEYKGGFRINQEYWDESVLDMNA